MAGKANLMSTLMYHVLYCSKAVLDQLKSGLSTLGVLDAMASCSDVIEPFLVYGKQPTLTAGIFQ